jgi:hypothetical protein
VSAPTPFHAYNANRDAWEDLRDLPAVEVEAWLAEAQAAGDVDLVEAAVEVLGGRS